MSRPFKLHTAKAESYIRRKLLRTWPLGRIAAGLKVHRHTLSRFIRTAPELERLYRENYETRLCHHIVEREYRGKHRDHPLRAIFLCERFHLLDGTPRRRARSSYRLALAQFPETRLPLGPVGTERPV